ncbi:MAG TPA: hypothetical protein VGB39_01935 [Sphingomicrobium sp.]|jgi:hypothetical protein
MIERLKWSGMASLLLVGACNSEAPAPRQDGRAETLTVELDPARPAPVADDRASVRASVPAPSQADAGRYTSIDPASCRLIEQNVDEGGYSRHACDGPSGYKLEISESDLRQDIVVIAPGGGRTELQLSSIVAKGAFNSLGKTAEWRGSGAKPSALIVRLNVARGPEPTRPDISNLVVARLSRPTCVVAVVPPGPDQNGSARRIADGPMPGCIVG